MVRREILRMETVTLIMSRELIALLSISDGVTLVGFSVVEALRLSCRICVWEGIDLPEKCAVSCSKVVPSVYILCLRNEIK
jgi:hypothetical protein